MEFMRFEDNDPKSQNSRITDILLRYKLDNRIFDIHNSEWAKSIDYSEVNQVLDKDIQLSMNFLLEALV